MNCANKVGNLPSGVNLPALTALAEYSAGNGTYNGLCLVNQKAVVLDAAAVAATHSEYPIDQHKTVLAGVTGTHQWLSTGQPTDVNGYSLKYAATSTASGQLGSKQVVEDYLRYVGQEVTRSRLVKSNSSDARLVIDDGVTKTSSDPHTGGGGWELLTVTATIDAAPTKLECYAAIASSALANVSIATGDNIEFTDARLDLGENRLSGDRELAEELALCRRYAWSLVEPATHAGDTLAVGQCYSSTAARVFARCPIPMRATPTATVNNGANFRLTNAANSAIPNTISVTLSPTSDEKMIALDVTVASGLVAGNVCHLNARNLALDASSILLTAEL